MLQYARTLLYVEDEALIALNQKRILEEHGFTVITATSGEKAVATARSHPEVDLVIMDINLGTGIDGREAAEQILAERDIPLIFLTSHSSRDYVDRVKQISNYGYVVKNSGEFVLIETIESAFRLHDALSSARQQSRRNEAILRAIPDMVFVFDRSGQILDFKGPAGANLYLPPEEFLGKHVSQVLPPDMAELTETRITQVLTTQDPLDYEYQLPINGTPAYFHARMVPYGSDQTFTVVQDITSVHTAEASLKDAQSRAHLFAEAAFEGVLVHDHGTIEFVNQALCDLTGYTPQEMQGANVLSFIHPDDRHKVSQAIAHNVTDRYENRVLRNDGSEFIAHVRARFFEDHGTTYRVAVVQDITDSKRTQHQLETQVSDMQQFITEVQHRIKNNFAAIESLLTLKTNAAQDPAVSVALAEATASVTASRALYEQLLEIQHENSIRTRSYLTDIATLVLRSFEAHPRIEILPMIADLSLDAKRAIPLATLLTELLTNAIKYAYPPDTGGAIEITLAHNGATATLTVSDNGQGFNLDASHANNGTHLGLNIVHILAQQLHGTLHLESSPGTGTTARLEFPYSPSPTP